MKSLALAAALMVASSSIGSDGLGMPRSRFRDPDLDDREPKNKYNLTPEQIEAMAEMSPKEKKKYLKAIGKVKS